VRQPIREKGEQSARLLLRMVTSPDLERPEHKVLETHLMIRGSTGPAPGDGR
jgi:DNA-binding LacI/PurR family transcriptional regulator